MEGFLPHFLLSLCCLHSCRFAFIRGFPLKRSRPAFWFIFQLQAFEIHKYDGLGIAHLLECIFERSEKLGCRLVSLDAVHLRLIYPLKSPFFQRGREHARKFVGIRRFANCRHPCQSNSGVERADPFHPKSAGP